MIDDINIDSLYCQMTAKDARLLFAGYCIKHFMQFKDNYFGDFSRFFNHVDQLDSNESSIELENAFDFQMGLSIDDLTIDIPEQLYSDRNSFMFHSKMFEINLRYRPGMIGDFIIH